MVRERKKARKVVGGEERRERREKEETEEVYTIQTYTPDLGSLLAVGVSRNRSDVCLSGPKLVTTPLCAWKRSSSGHPFIPIFD